MMETAAYGAKLRNEEQRMNSSSGGAFTALSDVILASGGAIAACVYDYERRALKFRLLRTAEERDAAIGSKYIQADAGSIYADCLQWLKENGSKPLMFIGMGCQADAFRRYLELAGKEYRSRVILADIICTGVPSPKLWQEYQQTLERRYGQPVRQISFKDKRRGWKRPTAIAKLSNEEVWMRDYAKVYGSRTMLRESCYHCPFAKVHRETDITIGDFWGIEKHYPQQYDEKGVSLVLVHTPQGDAFWKEAARAMEFFPISAENGMQNRLRSPSEKTGAEEKFWADYRKHGVEYVMKKYGTDSLMKRIRRKIGKMLKLFR